MSEPKDVALERSREWRRAQRQLARAHHPDVVGGNTERYVRLMGELERQFSAEHPAAVSRASSVPVGSASALTRSHFRNRMRRRLRASGLAVRTVRSRLPRRVPGARRYIEL